jgi:hypothetical protein
MKKKVRPLLIMIEVALEMFWEKIQIRIWAGLCYLADQFIKLKNLIISKVGKDGKL